MRPRLIMSAVSLASLGTSLRLLRNLDGLSDRVFNARLVAALLIWSMGLLLLGVLTASLGRRSPAIPCCAGTVIGVAPTVLYCLALAIWRPGIEPSSILLSIAHDLQLPLRILVGGWSALVSIHSSHATATALAQGWLAVTAANTGLWFLIGTIVERGAKAYRLLRHAPEDSPT